MRIMFRLEDFCILLAYQGQGYGTKVLKLIEYKFYYRFWGYIIKS